VEVVLTLVQTKQIRINIHKRNNAKNTVKTIQNTLNTITHQNTHTLQNPHIHTPTHYKTHTYTHPHITKPTHTHTRTLQNKLKQPQYKIYRNEIVTIQSGTLSIRSL
jgi:hypothetical protein